MPRLAQGQADMALHRPPTEAVDTPVPSLAEWSQGTPAREVAQQKRGLHQAFELQARGLCVPYQSVDAAVGVERRVGP